MRYIPVEESPISFADYYGIQGDALSQDSVRLMLDYCLRHRPLICVCVQVTVAVPATEPPQSVAASQKVHARTPQDAEMIAVQSV